MSARDSVRKSLGVPSSSDVFGDDWEVSEGGLFLEDVGSCLGRCL